MQLQFLGSTYNTDASTIETAEAPISGTYRGQQVVFRHPQPKSFNSSVVLRYRGQRYLR